MQANVYESFIESILIDALKLVVLKFVDKTIFFTPQIVG